LVNIYFCAKIGSAKEEVQRSAREELLCMWEGGIVFACAE
jgi:hypothetical protein